MPSSQVTIIGAGPAGLTAAYELASRGRPVVIYEASDQIGGISRTETYRGYRFDIGGHRFYTKVDEVERLWHTVLGDDFIERPRLSRIFYNGHFYHYPLKLQETLYQLGPAESIAILASYLAAQVAPQKPEDTFEAWVINRFGRRLYEIFFRTYTEKVWGIPCNQIRAEWAAQRIKGLSLHSAVTNALLRPKKQIKTLINQFHYPTHGPGMMWETFADRIQTMGGQVRLGTRIERVCHDQQQVTGLMLVDADRRETEISVDEVISSMPLAHLIRALDPPPPPDVLAAAASLRYRDFLVVGLIVDRAHLFDDNWIYVHSPQVQVGRIQNFKNWSEAMVPDQTKTSLGMEYFCSEGDAIWRTDDDTLIQLAARELEQLGLARAADVEDGVVIRQRRAYPVYDETYYNNLTVIRSYLNSFGNLQTIGRNGLHRYNNQDHSMLTGLLAARNLLGEQHDVWNVNTERSYYESFMREEPAGT